jgi:diaminopimelate decarboxylase
VPDVSVTPEFLSAIDLANLINFAQSEKWGASVELAVEIFEKLSARGANLIGLNANLGRVLKQDWSFAFWGDHFGKAVADFIDRTGASPKYLDIGGGWTRSRDPMPSAYQPRKPATAGLVEFTQALRVHLNDLTELPVIEVEIGRFIVGNAAATIAKVVNRKVDLGHTWLHVDISTNFLLRIDKSKYKYVVLPAKQTEETADTAVLVGETCVDSTINDQFKFVGLVEGDLVVILDTKVSKLFLLNTLINRYLRILIRQIKLFQHYYILPNGLLLAVPRCETRVKALAEYLKTLHIQGSRMVLRVERV